MPVERVLSREWLPKEKEMSVFRVIVHWTAGRYRPSIIDRTHYHFLIAGDGKAQKGVRSPGEYLPHTRNLNTGSIGLAICAMTGAIENKTVGDQPLTRLQWERAAQAAAEICFAYDLPVTERTVLFHSEVENVYGKAQRGKWDINVLPFDLSLNAKEIHDQFRRKTEWYLQRLKERE